MPQKFHLYLTIIKFYLFQMSGREGGKKKPLKAPKKGEKDLDENDVVIINFGKFQIRDIFVQISNGFRLNCSHLSGFQMLGFQCCVVRELQLMTSSIDGAAER